MSKLLQTLGLTGQLTGTQPNTQMEHRIKQSRVASTPLPFDNILKNRQRLNNFKDADSFISLFFNELEKKANNDNYQQFRIQNLKNIFTANGSNDGKYLFDQFLLKFKEEYNNNPTYNNLEDDFINLYFNAISRININNFPQLPNISRLDNKNPDDIRKIITEVSKYIAALTNNKNAILSKFNENLKNEFSSYNTHSLLKTTYINKTNVLVENHFKNILGSLWDDKSNFINLKNQINTKIKSDYENLLWNQMAVESNYQNPSSIFLKQDIADNIAQQETDKIIQDQDIKAELSKVLLKLFDEKLNNLFTNQKIQSTDEAETLKQVLSGTSQIDNQTIGKIFETFFGKNLPNEVQSFLDTYIYNNNNYPWHINFKEFKIEPIEKNENKLKVSWIPEIIWNNQLQTGNQNTQILDFQQTILISKLLNQILVKFKNNIQNINNIIENTNNTKLIDVLIKNKNNIKINDLIKYEPFQTRFNIFKNEVSSDLNLLNNKFYNNKTPDEVLNEVLKYIKPSINSYDEKTGKINLNIDYYGSIDKVYLNKFYFYEQNSINKQANNIKVNTIIKEFNDIFSSLANVNKPVFNEELQKLIPNKDGYIPITDGNNINDNLKTVLKSIFNNQSIDNLERTLKTNINKGSLFLKKENNLVNFYVKPNGDFNHYKVNYIKLQKEAPLSNFKDYLQKQFNKLDIENKETDIKEGTITNSDLYKIMPSLTSKFDLENFMKIHNLSINDIHLKEHSLNIKFKYNSSSFKIKKDLNGVLSPEEKQKTVDELRQWISNEKQFINILKDEYLPKSKKEIINDLNKLETDIDKFENKKDANRNDQKNIKKLVKDKTSEFNNKIENKIKSDLEKLNKDEIDKILDFANKNLKFLELDKNKKYNIKEIENELHKFLTSKKLNVNELNHIFDDVDKTMDTITKYGLLATGALLGLGSLGMGGAAISGATTQSALAKSGANTVKKSKALIAIDAGLAIIAAAGSIGLFIFLFIVKGGI